MKSQLAGEGNYVNELLKDATTLPVPYAPLMIDFSKTREEAKSELDKIKDMFNNLKDKMKEGLSVDPVLEAQKNKLEEMLDKLREETKKTKEKTEKTPTLPEGKDTTEVVSGFAGSGIFERIAQFEIGGDDISKQQLDVQRNMLDIQKQIATNTGNFAAVGD